MSFFSRLWNSVRHGKWQDEAPQDALAQQVAELQRQLEAARQGSAPAAPSPPVVPTPPPPAPTVSSGSFFPPGAFGFVSNSEGQWAIGPAPDYVVYLNGQPTGANALTIKKIGDAIYLGGAGDNWFKREHGAFTYVGKGEPIDNGLPPITRDPPPMPPVKPPAEPPPVVPPVVAPPVVTPAPQWPQIITVDGVRIMAKAPINPAWKQSMTARMFGTQGNSYVWDPANGDEANPPMPLRSQAGFPIRYTIANGHVVGTGTILYGDNGFNSDAEIVDWLKRTAQSAEELAKIDADWNRVYQGIRDHVGSTPTTPPPAPTPAPGVLANSYPDRAALDAAIAAVNTQFAVTLDGAVIKEGFARDNGRPYEYVTTSSGLFLQ